MRLLSKLFSVILKLFHESRREHTIKWNFPCFSDDPHARRGTIVAIVLAFLCHASGNFLFLTYASKIFEESGSHLSANASSIILATVQIAGTLVAAKFIESQGRKPLLIVSLAGCSIGIFTIASFLYCKSLAYDLSMLNWVPVTSMAFVIFISSIGIVPLGSICTVEVLPPNVRTIGLTLGMTSMNIFAFAITNTFPVLVQTIQLYGCMMILGACCSIGIFFVLFYMGETKGRALDIFSEHWRKCSLLSLPGDARFIASIEPRRNYNIIDKCEKSMI